MEIEEVIFLGAGASSADGAPIQSKLFKDYFSNGPHHGCANLKLTSKEG